MRPCSWWRRCARAGSASGSRGAGASTRWWAPRPASTATSTSTCWVEDEATALALLAGLGYAVETDRRPTRVELVAPGRGWVDLHPLQVTDAGGVRQAAPGGGWADFPPGCFTTGRLDGVPVPCVDAATQRLFRTGYAQRSADRHDLAQLDRLDPSG